MIIRLTYEFYKIWLKHIKNKSLNHKEIFG